MPQHHVPDDSLVAYAAGALGESERLLVACHLTLCPRCRDVVEVAERVGGALLAQDAPGAVVDGVSDRGPGADDALLAGVLGRLDEAAAPARPATDPKGIVPAPLYGIIGDLDSAPWKRVFPGMHMLSMPAPADGKVVALFRVAPGGRIPEHGHPGDETTLVLAGGFTDDEGHFERGDVSARDHTKPHAQVIAPGEPCVWLLVADERHVPRSLRGWLARIFFGL